MNSGRKHGGRLCAANCEQCGATFYRERAMLVRSKHLFCSRLCFLKTGKFQRNGSGELTGELKTCKICSGTFYIRPYRLKRPNNGQYCSAKCRLKFHEGDNNPNYKHGLSDTKEYRHVYAANRRTRTRTASGTHTTKDLQQRLKQQQYRCYICNKKLKRQQDGTYVYHVDHWIPLSKGGSNNARNLRITHPKCNLEKSALLPILFAQKRGLLLL